MIVLECINIQVTEGSQMKKSKGRIYKLLILIAVVILTIYVVSKINLLPEPELKETRFRSGFFGGYSVSNLYIAITLYQDNNSTTSHTYLIEKTSRSLQAISSLEVGKWYKFGLDDRRVKGAGIYECKLVSIYDADGNVIWSYSSVK